MVHVLLLVLKIIGILLLVLLVLAILLLSLILFLPVRYEIKADYYGTPHAYIRLHWLLHLLRAYVTFDLEQGLQYEVKALWFSLKQADRTSADRMTAADDSTERTQAAERDTEQNMQLTAEQRVQRDAERGMRQDVEQETQQNAERAAEKFAKKTSQEHDSEDFGKNKNIISRLAEKLRAFAAGIQQAADKILYIRERIVGAYEKLRNIVEDESNWEFVRFMKQQLKLVLSHIRPLRYNIYGKYGADSPDVTGKVTGVVAVVYAALDSGRTKGEFQFIPVFDEKVLELDMVLKGRIRFLTMLRIVLRVYRNKKFQELFRN